jgi:DNA polymerase I-like protein with 3'-5' exonuclease and polymerase domains
MDGSYQICWTVDDWVQALRRSEAARSRGLDFETCPDPGRPEETSALRAEDGARIAGIGIAWRDESGRMRSAYCPIRHDRVHAGGQQPSARHCVQALSDSIARTESPKNIVVANLQMELSMLLAEGAVWPGPGQIDDIMIAARVLNKGVGPEELIGLGPLQVEVLKRDQDSSKTLDQWLTDHRYKPGRDIWHAPAAIAGWYCQDDARDTLEIWERWEGEVKRPSPTEWWWSRPADRATRHDLYELEVEAGVQALIACLRGTRVDVVLARRRASAAQALQSAVARWIRDELQMPTLNPGSQQQLRGILFGPLGFEVSVQHLTEAFTKKLPEREQARVIAGTGKKKLVEYASLDVDALEYYAERYPQHERLMFMLAVYRKCNTAISWFGDRVTEFGCLPGPDPWWEPGESIVNIIYHRLRTVGTRFGRMSSSDYNGQQVPKRFKMLIDAEALREVLEGYLPESQIDELWAMLDIAECAGGDEAKATGLSPGAPVVDFSIKRMFVPREGMNIRNWDLSQVEMRGFAHFSGNRLLCDGYGAPMTDADVDRELEAILHFCEHGALPSWAVLDRHARLAANEFDIHAFVAQEIEISRKAAKGVNFGIVYGMGEKKLGRQLGWSKSESALFLGRYHHKFHEIRELQEQIKAVLRRRGYIFDPYGRRYYLPMNRAYVGLNRLIQGWAASAFKVGFVRSARVFASPSMGGEGAHRLTRRPMPGRARILTAIHDEKMSEVAKDLDTFELDWAVRSCMVAHHGLKVPLGTSSEGSDRSWDDEVVVNPPIPRVGIQMGA